MDTLDECLVDVGICYVNVSGGAPMFGGSGVRYAGTATLVGISQVPLPASAWLMFSALGALFITARRRACAGGIQLG